jgi:hypothetical protein
MRIWVTWHIQNAMTLADILSLCTDPVAFHADVEWMVFLTYRSFASDDEFLQLLSVSWCA